ncbi:MAG: hypothetical protein R2728_10980 [Chitinophagales bacterium]
MKKREELLAKPNLTIEDIEYLEKIDNEIGHLPTGETLNDFQTMHLLRKIVSKSKINDKISRDNFLLQINTKME